MVNYSRSEILDWYNNINTTCKKFSYDKTIVDLFEKTAERCPHKTAIHVQDKVINYQVLNEQANQLANLLRENGVCANQVVAVGIERSYYMMLAIFAILKAGAAFVILDKFYPKLFKQKIIDDCSINVLISDDVNIDINCKLVNIHDDFSLYQSGNLLIKRNPSDLAYVVYTSGSTGQPKGIKVQHDALMNRIEWMQDIFPISESDRLFQKTYPCFDVAIWEIFWWALYGASVVLLEPAQEHDVRLITKTIASYQVTVIHFVPTMLILFLDYLSCFDINKLSSLRYTFCSGENLDRNTVDQFYLLFTKIEDIKLVNLYGPSEATIDVTYHICERNSLDRLVPIGKPIYNTQLYVMNESQELQYINQPGELYIAGIGLAQGYCANLQLTWDSFIPNPFNPQERLYKTGDYVKWNDKNELIFISRKDSQVKLHGCRIELTHIEYQLKSHDNVQDAIVILKEITKGLL